MIAALALLMTSPAAAATPCSTTASCTALLDDADAQLAVVDAKLDALDDAIASSTSPETTLALKLQYRDLAATADALEDGILLLEDALADGKISLEEAKLAPWEGPFEEAGFLDSLDVPPSLGGYDPYRQLQFDLQRKASAYSNTEKRAGAAYKK